MEQSQKKDSRCLSYTSQKRQRIIVLIIFCGSFLFFYTNNSAELLFSKKKVNNEYPNSSEAMKYLVRTKGCTIPAMEPLNEKIKMFVTYPNNFKPCAGSNMSLIESNGSHILVTENSQILKYYNVSNRNHVYCCVSSFYRPTSIGNIYEDMLDHIVEYNQCRIFKNNIPLNEDDEFVRVLCVSKTLKVLDDDFFIFARKKKMIYRSKESTREIPLYNVLILGIDSVSRLNFHRTMPKTLSFFREKDGVELLGFNKIGSHSFPNIIALLTGYSDKEINQICRPVDKYPYDSCPFLWHRYKYSGFYTALGEDSSLCGTFNYLAPGFFRNPTDYYMRTFVHEAETLVGQNKVSNTYLCLKRSLYYKVMLDYVESLTKVVNVSRLFGFFWEISMTHDNLNFPMLIDDHYEQFFRRLDTSGYLDKTFILLMSDHGMRWGSIRLTRQGYFEERLPLAYILTPKYFQEKYRNAYLNLRKNSRSLTTPFDLHETLVDLIDLRNIMDVNIEQRSKCSYSSNRGISLFLPILENRTCSSAGILEHWCSCHQSVPTSNENIKVEIASKYLIQHLNLILKDHPECEPLYLEKIIKSENIVANVPQYLHSSWKELIVTVRAKPSKAIFEGTLREADKVWSVIGPVSRLNLYGNQSYCVNDAFLKPYCFCRHTK